MGDGEYLFLIEDQTTVYLVRNNREIAVTGDGCYLSDGVRSVECGGRVVGVDEDQELSFAQLCSQVVGILLEPLVVT